MTPIWLTLLVAVIAVVGPWLAYRASLRSTNAIRLNAIEANSTANRALEQAAETARQSNEVARQASALAASKSNREAIMQAITRARSTSRHRGDRGRRSSHAYRGAPPAGRNFRMSWVQWGLSLHLEPSSGYPEESNRPYGSS
jgi:hypothetical protein